MLKLIQSSITAPVEDLQQPLNPRLWAELLRIQWLKTLPVILRIKIARSSESRRPADFSWVVTAEQRVQQQQVNK